ncbi:hypothetical protein EVAR_79594_1 [Eumeta japonica]|uniref:Uncharacterized protein n=1 Tax=Eumeta variegata TaxID=151549 RepID=A0A4C1UF52_EUMVA|nr:hypothetical protein EVAR_79594_1 [Eumeta japonica]
MESNNALRLRADMFTEPSHQMRDPRPDERDMPNKETVTASDGENQADTIGRESEGGVCVYCTTFSSENFPAPAVRRCRPVNTRRVRHKKHPIDLFHNNTSGETVGSASLGSFINPETLVDETVCIFLSIY